MEKCWTGENMTEVQKNLNIFPKFQKFCYENKNLVYTGSFKDVFYKIRGGHRAHQDEQYLV